MVSVSRVHSLAFLQVRRAGEARADAVHQRGGKLHDMRVIEALVANALIHVQVQRLGGGLDFGIGVDGRGRCGFGFIGGIQGNRAQKTTPQERGEKIPSAFEKAPVGRGVYLLVEF